MSEDLDRLLAYRNFLAAEDHLDELLGGVHSIEEESFLTGIKNEVEYLRDDIMPKEVNKDFHCVVKHIATAYEACREVAKATHEDLDIERAKAVRSLLVTLLEKLWDRKIVTCERCMNYEPRGIQTEDSGDIIVSTFDGFSGKPIQGVGDNRVDGLYGREAVSYSGSQDCSIERIIKDREGQDTSDPFGEPA